MLRVAVLRLIATIAAAIGITVQPVPLTSAAAQTKVALSIGNSNYVHARRLKNPINDAREIAKLLTGIGFSVVTVEDVKKAQFADVFHEFAKRAAKADFAVVYYAGHGIQVSGTNYLIPVDSEVADESDVRRLIRAEDVLKDAALAKRLAVVILDACRDNPFVKTLAESGAAGAPGRTMVVDRGLARISAVPRDTLIGYSTQAGNIALDGTGPNSPYAIALMQHLHAENKDVRMVFGSVRDSVLHQTSQKQEPFIYGSLGGEALYLNAKAETGQSKPVTNLRPALEPVLVAPTDIQPPPPRNQLSPISEEFVAWQEAKQTNDWTKVSAVVAKYPGSLYSLVGVKMLEQRAKEPSLTVVQATAALKGEAVDLATLRTPFLVDLQKSLKDANYYSGETTGTADAETLEALAAFNRDVFRTEAPTYQTLLALTELTDRASFSEAMSGRWKGRYYYPHPVDGVTDVPFEMNLILSQGRVTGFVSEPNTFGNPKSRNLYAIFSGRITGNQVKWTKTYDGTGEVSHSVFYTGTLDRSRRRIEGEWKIRENWSGRFFIELPAS